MTERKKVRVQIDLLPSEAAALDELKQRCGLRSRSDAVCGFRKVWRPDSGKSGGLTQAA